MFVEAKKSFKKSKSYLLNIIQEPGNMVFIDPIFNIIYIMRSIIIYLFVQVRI